MAMTAPAIATAAADEAGDLEPWKKAADGPSRRAAASWPWPMASSWSAAPSAPPTDLAGAGAAAGEMDA